MRSISVQYGELWALRNVDFDLYRGEIHALVGEHRAGKSSLVKLLSGAVRKREGEIIFQGRRLEDVTPSLAIKKGIGIVYQNLSVIPALNAVENIFTGKMIRTWYGSLHHSSMIERTIELFKKIDVEIDIHRPLYKLPVGHQHMVEFARVLMLNPELIILDELSNKLTPEEMKKVYRTIFEYRNNGKSVIYITHNMDEILRLADRVTILKDGYRRGTEQVKELDKFRLFQLTYSFTVDREKLEYREKKLFLITRYVGGILQNLPIGAVVLDSRNRVHLINSKAREILDYQESDVVLKPAASLLDKLRPEDSRQILAKIDRRQRHSFEELTTRHGLSIRCVIFPFEDERGVTVGTVLLLQDVSIDRDMEDYLIRSEKMASIAEVSVGVAHEINNPLFIIQNYVELLKKKNLEEDAQFKLSKIENELRRIMEIVSSLLSFSRVKNAPLKDVKLSALIEDVLLLLHHNILEKNIQLQKRFAEAELGIRGDENRLKQMLLNLVMNSIEAVLDRGIIRLTLSSSEQKGFVEIGVRDNGYGIPEDIQGRIFQPFYSSKINKKNTGLGLSICQQIAEEHGGIIDFVSRPGQFTEFLVRLPLRGAS
ncbi:MAG: ATP-binding cassette domain-containing protein [Spirochaetales bacterium]|nr:ATP-binding cassette domain-containing protein [Spirochaetales bacterium]